MSLEPLDMLKRRSLAKLTSCVSQTIRSFNEHHRQPPADAPAHAAASGLDCGHSRSLSSGVLDLRTLGARGDSRRGRCSIRLGLLAGANSPLGDAVAPRLPVPAI